MTRKGQVKKFAPKVRSGCVTCKRRRLKCDEAKPQCHRCLQSRLECEGFRVPKPWIFEPLPRRIWQPFDAVNNKTRRAVSDEEPRMLQPKTVHQLGKYRVENPSLMQNHLSNQIGDAVDGQSLHFWLLETAPTLSTYGPHGFVWTTLIPSMSERYDVVKHVLLATAMIDRSRGYMAPSSNLRARAFCHYQSAISNLRTNEQPFDVIVVASLLAWVFETMLGELSAALIHITAALKLAQKIEDSPLHYNESNRYITGYSMKNCLQLSNLYTRTMFSQGLCHDHSSHEFAKFDIEVCHQIRITSLREAQNLIETEIDLFNSTLRMPADAARFRIWLRKWQYGILVYRWYGTESFLYKRSTHLFFNVAMAMLPPCEVGSYSYEADTATTEHILTTIELIMDQTLAPGCDDREPIRKVLRALLKTTFEYFPETGTRQQRERLLQRLNIDTKIFSNSSTLVPLVSL